MFLNFDLHRVWYLIFSSNFIDCIFFNTVVQYVCFEKGRGHVVVGKETSKYMQAFWKSPRFSLTSPLCQLREKSFSFNIFYLHKSCKWDWTRECVSPCLYSVWWCFWWLFLSILSILHSCVRWEIQIFFLMIFTSFFAIKK